MINRDVSQPYIETGHQVESSRNHRAEDEPDLEGYDESQRAEIAEAEGDGPNDGVMQTDMRPDLGGDIDEDEIEDGPDQPDTIIDADGIPIN